MPSAVLIGASDVMAALRERTRASGDALCFADSEPLQALKAITTHRPPLVVLERLFAATPRGAALINRIKSDPSLSHAEVRVVSHSGDYVRTVSAPAPVAMAAAVAAGEADAGAVDVAPLEPPRPLDWHGTRRAPRHRLREGMEALLDGGPALLVDLSVIGAQAVSPRALRPNQKVRIVLQQDNDIVRLRGGIVWAKFELARSPAEPHYRVGVEFTDAEATAAWLESFCQKNQA